MKVRSLIIAILTGVIALSIVGANAYGWVIEHRSILLLNRTIKQPPATAIFVPKNASAVISLLANLDDLGNLHRLATPAQQKRAEYHAIAQWKQWLADRVHLDYQREIATWLGEEITLAMTDADLDRNIRNGLEPGYLAVLSSRNGKVSESKIQAWWNRQIAAHQLEFETYQGVKIGYNRRDRVASAMVANKYVLFANHPKILREAINHLEVSNLSILDNSTYQKILAANNHHRIGVGYGEVSKLAPWLGKAVGEKYPEAGFNLGVDRQGAIADIVFYPTADSPGERLRQRSVSQPSEKPEQLINALKYLPSQSTIAIAGKDLAHWRGQLTNIVPPSEQLLSLVDSPLERLRQRTIAAIDTQFGIDSNKDIFSWATGEYALAAIPNPTHKVTDWVFVAERTQPELVDAAIAHFDELAHLAGYNVGLLPWQERAVIGWTKLATKTSPTNTTQLVAQVPFTHTTVAGYTILASSVEAMDSTLKAIDGKSVLDSDRYHRAIDLIAANQTGYLYGNWDTIQSLLPKHLLIKSFGEGILSGLPNLSLNSYTEDRTQRITLLFQVD